MKKFIIPSILLLFVISGCSNDNEPDNSNKINGHEYVDLGLPSGIKWSICNLGASTSEGYGNYYSWGITQPETHSMFEDVSVTEIGGTQYDAAHLDWGGSWRMATLDEWDELVNNCEWTWVSNGAKSGYKIIGPNSNSIFLPACGIYQGGDEASVTETQAYYWTSTRCPGESAYNAWGLHMGEGHYGIGGWNIPNGMAIRPVSN